MKLSEIKDRPGVYRRRDGEEIRVLRVLTRERAQGQTNRVVFKRPGRPGAFRCTPSDIAEFVAAYDVRDVDGDLVILDHIQGAWRSYGSMVFGLTGAVVDSLVRGDSVDTSCWQHAFTVQAGRLKLEELGEDMLHLPGLLTEIATRLPR